MSPLRATTFRLRHRYQEGEETVSEKEILRRIAAGKLTGEEEIAAEPNDHWQKLASHPQFYDAFLKRLFAAEYASPDPEPEKPERRPAEEESRVDRATRQADASQHAQSRHLPPGQADEEEAGGGKTRHLVNADGTMHQSMIDELFSEAGVSPEGEERGGGTALVKVDEAPEPDATALGDAPAEPALGPPPSAPVPPDEEVLARQKAQRKKWAIRGGLVLLLFLLWQMGSGPSGGKPGSTTEGPTPASLAPRTALSSASKELKVSSLAKEGDLLTANDSPLFYQGAVDVFREAQSYDETNPQLLGKATNAAARLLPTSSDKEALVKRITDDIQRGRLADPHFSTFYRVEALMHLDAGKLQEAQPAAENAYETDPTNAENMLVLGEVALARGEQTQARTAFEEAVKAAPQLVRARYMLARLALEQNDIARSRAEALEALKTNPLHPPSYLLLADISALQNQLKEARGLYETSGRLARFGSRDIAARAYYRLGRLHEASGNKVEADLAFRLAYYYDPKIDAGLDGKVSGLDVGESSLKKIAAETEYGPDYFREQAEGLLEQNKINEAIRFFQAAQLLNPADGLALIRLGEVTEKIAMSYEDFRGVMNYYERALENDPTQAKAYIKLGLIETEQYNWGRAFKLLKQAVALAPEDAEPYVALGKFYFKQQDYNNALTQFLEANNRPPKSSEVFYYAGVLRLLVKRDAMREAMPYFYQAYTLDPENYDALAEWLKLKVLTYEKNFALKFMQNLIAKEPNNGRLYWVLGEIYQTNSEPRRAIAYFHKSLDLDNRASKTRMSLAAALQSVGELDKAVAEYRLASLLDRRNSEGFYKAADLLFQMKNYAQAEEVLKYLISVTPNYPGAHRYLAKIYQLRRQKDQALAEMKLEVDNNPENNLYVVELGEMYMEYEKYDAAIEVLKKVTNLPAVTKTEDYRRWKIRAFLLLSRCYRSPGLNRADSAEAAVKLAMELDPSDPELYRELGYVYHALQRDKEGVRAFEFYLQKNPSARDADQIRGMIQKMMIED